VKGVDLPTLLGSIGIRRDYSDLDLEGIEPDLQGWGSRHPMMERLLSVVRPELVIEVGTWKGKSALYMHEVSRRLGLETSFICVDTWLGSAEHWIEPAFREHLRLRGGFPTLYLQFVVNVIAHDAVADIYPLPLSSPAAATVLADLGVVADIVYLDASHDEDEVGLDLSRYWPLVRTGGILFGHDYGENWPGVVQAVDRFAAEHELDLETESPMWLLQSPP
jgi:methyltransferase family protein